MEARKLLVLCVVALPWTIGCSGGDSTAADADGGDADAGEADAGEEAPAVTPEPPDIPWLDAGQPPIAPPVLTPCPEGWREVTDPESGTVTCDPWPETGYEECAAIDEAHFPGEPGCTRIGTACSPDDDWAQDLPADAAVLYVKAGAPAGGTGTRHAPFATIAQATAAASTGTVIALSKGAFDEAVLVGRGVTLWGACVAETVVTCSEAAELAGTITVRGRDTVVRNLRVSGSRPGIWVAGATSVSVEAVLVAQAVMFGASVDNGAVLSGRDLIVRGTLPGGVGRPQGRALDVSRGGTVEIVHAVFLDDAEAGVVVYNPDSTARLTDVVIRGAGGRGVGAQSGSRVEITHGVLDANRGFGVTALGAGTAVVLADSVIRDTEPSGGARTGRGLEAQEGATITAERVLLDRNADTAISASGPGTAVTLSDAVVRATTGTDVEQSGRGLVVEDQASAEVARVLFDRSTTVAISVAESGSSARITDVVVHDTRAWTDGSFGHGLHVNRGARVDIARALFDRNHEAGAYAVGEGTELVAEDIVVRDTLGSEADGTWGRGLQVESGARCQVNRGLFAGNREVSVVAGGDGASLGLSDVCIIDTLERECATGGCPGLGAGTGVGAYCGGYVEATRFLAVRGALCGLQLAHGVNPDGTPCAAGGTMDLHEGEIAWNGVCGANVQTEGFDLDRLLDNVLFHDNAGTNVDMGELPVPEVGTPIEE